MENNNGVPTARQAHNLLGQNVEKPRKYDNALTRTLKSYCFIPQRYILGIIGLLGVCNAMTMRGCLNIAIISMVNRTSVQGNETRFVDPDACPSEVVEANSTAAIESPYAIYNWDEKTQGMLLSGFYCGYLLTQVLGGYLAEKFGGKWTLGCGLLSTAIFTLLTPPVIRMGGAIGLFILRVLQGMGEGPTMPALMIMLARWVPPNERSTQGALIFGGAQVGNIFGSFMSGILLADGNWANVFYFFGGFGICWFILWSIFCYSTPQSHPFMSDEELEYLNRYVTPAKREIQDDPIPWKGMLRSAPVWALIAAAIGHDWGYYTIVTDLPKYAHDVLKFNVATTATLNGLPFVAMWISCLILGFICDFCIKKGWHSIRAGRVIHTTIAAFGPAVCIILASYAGCDRNLAMVYFILSMAFKGGFYPGMKVNALDLSPNYAGSLTSLVNTISTITGVITPFFIGLITPDSTLAQWRIAFWVCFAVLVCTDTVYIFWADGKQQWWDDVRQYGYPDGWNHGPLTKEDPEAKPLKQEKS